MSREWSIRKKIFLGYLMIIGIVLSFAVSMFAVLWERLNKDSIRKSIYSSNYQIKKSIDNYFDSIIKLSEFPYLDSDIMKILKKDYQGTDAEKKKIEQINDVKFVNPKIYRHVYYMNNQIDGVWLYPANMDSYAYRTNRTAVGTGKYHVSQESWFETVKEGNGKPYIIGVHQENGVSEDWEVISVARSIVNPIGGEYLGMIVIDCGTEHFAELWDSSEYSESVIAVSDKNGKFILPQSEEYAGELAGHLAEVTKNGEELQRVTFNQQTWYLAVTSLGYMEGEIYQLVPITDALRNVTFLLIAGIMALMVLGGVLIVLSARISNTITQPIDRLIATMETVESGNLSPQTEEFHGEMQVLSEKFHHMVRQVHTMFEELKETEKEKREMEMLALQSQINPHFMYNTLSSIQWLAELQGADRVTQMLDSLIQVLHYVAEGTGEYVPVKSEVEFIHNYIRILNFRYFERFSFIFDIQDEALEYEMPRFILQPLVENAVLHGFDSNDLCATVKLAIRLEEGHLILSVTDDGKGMTEEKIREILDGSRSSRKSLNKIGLHNVDQRIRLTYGEEHSIRVDSKEGCFTKVTVRIPARRYAGGRQREEAEREPQSEGTDRR